MQCTERHQNGGHDKSRKPRDFANEVGASALHGANVYDADCMADGTRGRTFAPQ